MRDHQTEDEEALAVYGRELADLIDPTTDVSCGTCGDHDPTRCSCMKPERN